MALRPMVSPLRPETIVVRMPILAFSRIRIGVWIWPTPWTAKYTPYEIPALSSMIVIAGSMSSK